MPAIFDEPRSAWSGLTYVDPAHRTGHRAHWNGDKVGLTPDSDHADCLAKVRAFRDYHVKNNGWLDLGYNTLICPHAIVIEGRGVDYAGSHSKGSNTAEYGTQLMVGEGDEIPEAMFEAFTRLHAELEEHSGHALALNVHRDPPDESGTTCPGDVIEARIHAMRPTPPPPPPPPPPTKDTVGETIRRGDRGAAVKTAQERLTAHGHPADPDGIFGAGTETAARNFQDAKRLDIDGVIGAGTWAALLEKTRPEMTAETLTILTKHGWRTGTQAVKDFQNAYNLGPWLDVDGVVGPATHKAAQAMDAAGGKLSANFTAAEFACRCGGKYADCRRIWVHRGLLAAAEKLRPLYGSLKVVSGCRCRGRNAETPGAYSRSQHLYGTGMDVEARFSISRIRSLGVFSGIGYNRVGETVRHVDVRHLGPDNYPYGSAAVPRRFAEG